MSSVFIIEDEIVVASSIQDILENNGYTVVGIATNYASAIKKLETVEPNLILCDINLKHKLTGIDLITEIRSKLNIPFIFISAYSNNEVIKEACKVEPLNYITKPFSEKQLLVALEHAFYQLSLINETDKPTQREKHILQLLSSGYSTKEIADELTISFYTVETHRKNLIRKYNVKNVTELISLALANQWITYEAK